MEGRSEQGGHERERVQLHHAVLRELSILGRTASLIRTSSVKVKVLSGVQVLVTPGTVHGIL